MHGKAVCRAGNACDMRCGEMRRKQQRTMFGAMFQRLVPGGASLLRYFTEAGVPVRLMNLERMMADVAAK